MSDEIWEMHIPEVIFSKWDNHTSARLVDEGFMPTTEDDIKSV